MNAIDATVATSRTGWLVRQPVWRPTPRLAGSHRGCVAGYIGRVMAARNITAWLVCALGACTSQSGPVTTRLPTRTQPAARELATIDDGAIRIVEVGARVTLREAPTLPEPARRVRWLDRDRLASLGDSGRLYVVDLHARTAVAIAMPEASAWQLPVPPDTERQAYPSRATLVGASTLSLVTCIGVDIGDIMPCVAWASSEITPHGALTPVLAGDLEPDDTAPSETLAPPSGFAVTATFEGPTASVTCAAAGVRNQRTFEIGDAPCAANHAEVSWVATDPPLLGLTLYHSCGSLAPGLGTAPRSYSNTRVLTACDLRDFEAAVGPIVWHGGWAHEVDGEGWHIHQGTRLVGTTPDGTTPPQLRPL